MFVTHRDASDNILIGGNSVVFYPVGGWDGYPAMWHVDINGDFPETDPVNFGAADDGTGREAKGLSSFCSGVMITGTFQCFEQYEDGTWVVPSHVAFHDGEHRELPGAGPYNRDTYVSGINDLGQIVGTYGWGGGIWQLNPDRTISGPISLGEFYPAAINNFGVMAGGYMGWPAIAWFEEDGTLTIMQLDSSLRFWGADANALNDCPSDDPALTVVGTSLRSDSALCRQALPDSVSGYQNSWMRADRRKRGHRGVFMIERFADSSRRRWAAASNWLRPLTSRGRLQEQAVLTFAVAGAIRHFTR